MKPATLHPTPVDQPRLPLRASATAHDRYRQTRFFSSLDGLRALSILAVIWHHTASAGATHAILHEGKKGVNLFFVISGFLIVTLLLRTKEQRGTFSLAKFWGRRALRIFPVYYAVLGLYVVLVFWLERDPVYRRAFFSHLPAFATFTSNWFVSLENPRVIFYFAWSLAAEEQFYLVWPWFERFLRGAWPLLAALVTLLVTQVVAIGTSAQNPMALPLALRIISSVPAAILLGVVLAHLLHSPATFRLLHGISGRRGSAVSALILLLAALSLAPLLGPPENLFIAVSMTLLVSACVIREDNDLARILSNPVVAWIGKVSYGMYLFHMIAVNVIHLLSSRLGFSSPYLDFAGGVLLAVGMASLSYLFFESRLLKVKDRLFRENAAPGLLFVGRTPTV
jgi:peptidoglycan/LPS O-acetylase OafA/YrhL